MSCIQLSDYYEQSLGELLRAYHRTQLPSKLFKVRIQKLMSVESNVHIEDNTVDDKIEEEFAREEKVKFELRLQNQ